MDFEQITIELYGLGPDEFIPARDEWARKAQAENQPDLAASIRALRKPVLAAWLANQLVRISPNEMFELLNTGDQLREAQSRLDGEMLRTLTQQRRAVVKTLIHQAKVYAASSPHRVGEAVLRQVEETLNAAVVDESARDTLALARLTNPLKHAGMGIGMPSLGVAEAPKPSAARKAPASGKTAKSEADARKQWRENVEKARRELAEAKDAQRRADQEVRDRLQLKNHAQGLSDRSDRHLERLKEELRKAEEERTTNAELLDQAREDHTDATSDAETAAERVEKARHRLSEITDASKR